MFHLGNEKEDLRRMAVGAQEGRENEPWLVKKKTVLRPSENISAVTQAILEKRFPVYR